MKIQASRFAAVLLLLFAPTPSRAHHTGGALKISNAWVREALPGKDLTAAFLEISNEDHNADALVGAACKGIDTVELHSMREEGGTMHMERIAKITIPAQGKVSLKQGGLHLMLFGLKTSVAAGAQLECELTFEHADPVKFVAPVKAIEGKADGKQ